MRKKILVYAYLEGNLGDDLMVWILCRRYPHVKFEVRARKEYKQRFKKLENLKVFGMEDRLMQYWDRFLKWKNHGEDDLFSTKVKKADALVQIGGSMYPQNDIWETLYMINLSLRNISRRLFVCGANFGPYTDEVFLEKYHELFGRYEGTCFRVRYSYELFSHLPRAGYAPDLVFGYEPSEKKIIPEKKRVLISTIQMKDRSGAFPLNQYDTVYKKFLAAMTEAYVDAGYEATFICFCQSQGDDAAAREVESLIPEKKRSRISHYIYENDVEEAVALFDEAEIVIGTRFHSIILGWMKGKRVLPIVYDQKTQHTLDDCGCSVYVTMDDLERAEIGKLMGTVERLPEHIREKYKEEAQRHFERLDCFLREER